VFGRSFVGRALQAIPAYQQMLDAAQLPRKERNDSLVTR
jgi:hypothetical protein